MNLVVKFLNGHFGNPWLSVLFSCTLACTKRNITFQHDCHWFWCREIRPFELFVSRTTVWPNKLYFSESDVGQYDFLFVIALDHVKKASSLAELVRACMGLSPASHHNLQAILEGSTKHKVILILDGYDKYIPGTNTNIDRLVELGLNSGSVILTCCLGKYLSSDIRNQMDAEVDLKGFDPERVSQWIQLYNFQKNIASNQEMLQNFHDLLTHSAKVQVPIGTLMVTLILIENKALAKTFTKLICAVQNMILTRASQTNFGCLPSELKDLEKWLSILGEISWKSLQKDIRQHLLEKVCFCMSIFILYHLMVWVKSPIFQGMLCKLSFEKPNEDMSMRYF